MSESPIASKNFQGTNSEVLIHPETPTNRSNNRAITNEINLRRINDQYRIRYEKDSHPLNTNRIRIFTDFFVDFSYEPAIYFYKPLKSTLLGNDEVYLLRLDGLKDIYPRRKIGSWVNVSRFKSLLTYKKIKDFSKTLKIECLNLTKREHHFYTNFDKSLDLYYHGVWLPLPIARKLAFQFEIYDKIAPLLTFNRVATTSYCGIEFYEFFVYTKLDKYIRILRKCSDNFMNLNQLFDVYENLISENARKNLRRIFLKNYKNQSGVLYESNDKTLCGGIWIPLEIAKKIANEYHISKFLDPILNLKLYQPNHSNTNQEINNILNQQSETHYKISRYEMSFLKHWDIRSRNSKSFNGYPAQFALTPEKLTKIRGGHIPRTNYSIRKNRVLTLKTTNFYNKTTKTNIDKAVTMKDVCEIYTFKVPQRKTTQVFYVPRRFSDGYINIQSLINCAVTITILEINLNSGQSKSDFDDDIWVENVLYYRDKLNVVDYQTIYIGYSLTNSYETCSSKKKIDLSDISQDEIELATLEKNKGKILNGKWCSIKFAQELIKEFHFNQSHPIMKLFDDNDKRFPIDDFSDFDSSSSEDDFNLFEEPGITPKNNERDATKEPDATDDEWKKQYNAPDLSKVNIFSLSENEIDSNQQEIINKKYFDLPSESQIPTSSITSDFEFDNNNKDIFDFSTSDFRDDSPSVLLTDNPKFRSVPIQVTNGFQSNLYTTQVEKQAEDPNLEQIIQINDSDSDFNSDFDSDLTIEKKAEKSNGTSLKMFPPSVFSTPTDKILPKHNFNKHFDNDDLKIKSNHSKVHSDRNENENENENEIFTNANNNKNNNIGKNNEEDKIRIKAKRKISSDEVIDLTESKILPKKRKDYSNKDLDLALGIEKLANEILLYIKNKVVAYDLNNSNVVKKIKMMIIPMNECINELINYECLENPKVLHKCFSSISELQNLVKKSNPDEKSGDYHEIIEILNSLTAKWKFFENKNIIKTNDETELNENNRLGSNIDLKNNNSASEDKEIKGYKEVNKTDFNDIDTSNISTEDKIDLSDKITGNVEITKDNEIIKDIEDIEKDDVVITIFENNKAIEGNIFDNKSIEENKNLEKKDIEVETIIKSNEASKEFKLSKNDNFIETTSNFTKSDKIIEDSKILNNVENSEDDRNKKSVETSRFTKDQENIEVNKGILSDNEFFSILNEEVMNLPSDDSKLSSLGSKISVNKDIQTSKNDEIYLDDDLFESLDFEDFINISDGENDDDSDSINEENLNGALANNKRDSSKNLVTLKDFFSSDSISSVEENIVEKNKKHQRKRKSKRKKETKDVKQEYFEGPFANIDFPIDHNVPDIELSDSTSDWEHGERYIKVSQPKMFYTPSRDRRNLKTFQELVDDAGSAENSGSDSEKIEQVLF
ncbi:uncharacterized protein ASCRUDRAFT_9142 [Ascoidea rubescens DSM 1968]|uniref:HTH APSES-type domain-containing protein n=1 Tax=Ascoidea rubescens DSM 1968 TaxID=1344418 RepID=A0A1D2VEM5_9ASCO|nr:hypothetical protein ASCRUDRAFT_9142 [Ascoidea rubescens DSM 1968]ODV59953.1 hypothetical protein ASCRUDRAFT_9142 [Ascoidea rubescens DSM 1968]